MTAGALLSCALAAFAAGTGTAKDCAATQRILAPEESPLFVRHVDTGSGIASWLLRPGIAGYNQQGLYFTIDSMTKDGRFLVFWVADDESTPGFEKDRDLACAFSRRHAVADLLEGRAYELGGAFKNGFLPFLDPDTAQLYQIDYEGVHRRDLRVDPMKDVLVCRTPKELVDAYPNPQAILATHLTLNRERTKAYLDTRSTTGPSRPGVLDLATGVFAPWSSHRFFANHGQISPVRDDESIGAWEGAWFLVADELSPAQRRVAKRQTRYPCPFVTDQRRPRDAIYPRIWLFRADGTSRMIPSRINGHATHEMYVRDGTGITFSCNDAKMFASSFTLHDFATDVQRDIVPYMTQHGTLSADGRYVVFDVQADAWWRGCPWRVGVWDRMRHRGVWIHTRMAEYRDRAHPSVLHPDPHPNFSPDGRYVICTFFSPDRRMNVSVTPFTEVERVLDGMPDPEPKRFRLKWDVSSPTDRTYELAFDWRRMVEEGKVDGPSLGVTWRPHTVYALEATVAGEKRRLAVEALPGASWRDLSLRFKVQEGTSELALLADLPERFEVRDTVTCDNLFAGEVEPAHPFGTRAKRFERTIPASLCGKRVKLEWWVRNQSGADAADIVRAEALRADGSVAGKLFDPREIGGAFENGTTRKIFAEGTVPFDTASIRLVVDAAGEMLTTRLVLREGTSLDLFGMMKEPEGEETFERLKAQADKTAAWQIATPVTTGRFVHEHTPLYWTMGAFYNGLLHWGLSEGSRSRFAEHVRRIGESEKWSRQRLERCVLGHADTHCVCAAWLQLAAEDNAIAGRIDSAKECFDALIADKTEYTTDFIRKDPLSRMRWTWADALYMSPPSWTLLSGITGESKYLRHMAKEFKITTERLFNESAGLFYRDSTYLPGGENWKGRDVFWSRGNGWVFGALAMILRDLPADFQDRGWFEELFRRMARGIAERQQPDGSWHPDLAAPKSPDCPEMSGTSFFAFAYMWGLNNGLLDQLSYASVAERAWRAVERAIDPDTGRLGYVQQIGSNPSAELKPEYFEFYATGAFLCAAAERKTLLALRAHPSAERRSFVNGPKYAPNLKVRLRWGRGGKPSVWDIRYCRPVKAVVCGDGSVEIEANFLAGQRRDFLLFPMR